MGTAVARGTKRTEEHKQAISEKMREYWADRYTATLRNEVARLGLDIVMARIREEVVACLASDTLPPAGDRRDLVKAVTRLIQDDESD